MGKENIQYREASKKKRFLKYSWGQPGGCGVNKVVGKGEAEGETVTRFKLKTQLSLRSE